MCSQFSLFPLVTEDKRNSTNNAQVNGKIAAELFCMAERSLANRSPFTWFFVRPPWAPSGVCCKACVFKTMFEYCSGSNVVRYMDRKQINDHL